MRDPFSLEAEQSVLGAMMKAPEMIDVLSADLSPADFYWQDNADVFKAIIELNTSGRPIDFLTVGEHIGNLGNGEGGPAFAYTAEIQKGTPSTANAEQYARIVRERSMDRSLIEAAREIHEIAHSTSLTSDKVAQAQAAVLAIEGESATQEVISAADVMFAHVEELQRREDLGGRMDGLSTGLRHLDEHICGLKPEQLIVIAGRAKMGKTTMAMGIARHVGIREQKSTLVISLEMSNKQLMDRMISAEGSITLDSLKNGTASTHHDGPLRNAATMIINSKLYLSDRPGLTMSRIRSMARRHKRTYGLELLLIDHLGLLDAEEKGMNTLAKVSEITRQAKLLAKELKIPVILLSQLNRALEQRPDKRPIPSDLRDSGTIEQDADLVLFVYRDEVYNPDSPRKGMAEIIVGIARDCSPTTIHVAYEGKYGRFRDLDPSTYIPDLPDTSTKQPAKRGMGKDGPF